MKKKTKTFAQRAKDIVKSFPRAKYDPIEKKALEEAMDKLMMEQEQYRNMMGMGNNEEPMQQSFPEGGMVPMTMLKPQSGQLVSSLDTKTLGAMTPNEGGGSSGADMSMAGFDPSIPGKLLSSIGDLISYKKPTRNILPEYHDYSKPNIMALGGKGKYIIDPSNEEALPQHPSINAANYYLADGMVPDYDTFISRSAKQKINEGGVTTDPLTGDVIVPKNNKTTKKTETTVTPATNETPALKRVIPELQSGLIRNRYGNVPGYPDYMGVTIGNKGFASGVNPPVGTLPITNPVSSKNLEIDKLNDIVANNKKELESKRVKNKNEFLPSYISAGANITGNLLQMLFDKKPGNTTLPTYTPEGIDLYGQKMNLSRDADVARAIVRNQARNMGLNAIDTSGLVSGSEADITRNLGKATTEADLAEQQYNVGARNQAAQFNAMQKMRNTMIDQQRKDMWRERNMNYLSGAIGTIPELMKDINMIKYQNKYLGQLSKADKNKLAILAKMYPDYTFDANDPVVREILYNMKNISGNKKTN